MAGSNAKTVMVLAACAVWLTLLGWIDCATGYELGLFAFYTAPVAVVAWSLGQRPGIAVAFIASVIWYVADRYAGDRYSTPFFGYWNTGMHFTSFIINAVTFAKIKSSLDQRHELARALLAAQNQLKRLAGLIPRCPRCHEPHISEPTPAKADECLAAAPLEAAPDAPLCGHGREQIVSGDRSGPGQRAAGAAATP